MNKIINDLEYAAFNLCNGKKYTDIPDTLIESTGPEDSLLIAIRELKKLSEIGLPEKIKEAIDKEIERVMLESGVKEIIKASKINVLDEIKDKIISAIKS